VVAEEEATKVPGGCRAIDEAKLFDQISEIVNTSSAGRLRRGPPRHSVGGLFWFDS
jgi:hypothetical protein